ncbi:MAG: hypothetical protein V1878_01135 [bacterium]
MGKEERRKDGELTHIGETVPEVLADPIGAAEERGEGGVPDEVYELVRKLRGRNPVGRRRKGDGPLSPAGG